jgi:cell division protein FtsQ
MANITLHKQNRLVKIWHYLPYILAFFVLISSIMLFIYSYANISNYVANFLSQNLNLKVNHLYVTGTTNTDPVKLRNAIEIEKGQSIFSVSTAKIRTQVESLSWVRLAQVQRILPDTLKVNIIEHKPIATINFNNKRWALNSTGDLIDIVDDKFNYLLELSGENSKENAASLFSLFSEWGNLLLLVKQAEFIGKRRWNLYLDNGIIVMLPEDNVRHALKVLKILNQQQNILNKENIKIDLRNIKKHIIVDEHNYML